MKNFDSDEVQESIDDIRRGPTKAQVEQARADLSALISGKLGRALSTGEEKVIRGWDEWLVAEGYIAENVRRQTPQDILGGLKEAGGGPGPVALLNSLATGRSSLKAGREKVREYLSPKGRKVLEAFDLEAALEDFTQWFLGVLRREPPGPKIRALWFVLFESDGGARLYVSGADSYDEEDPDWACVGDWSPKARHAPLDQLFTLWKSLRETGDEPWVITQALAIIIVGAFFDGNHQEFKRLTGFTRVHVACGFNDGDLYALRTPLAPKP